MLHRIDVLELFQTVCQIRQEALSLLAEMEQEHKSVRVRRMIVLLEYTVEHLKMVSESSQREEDWIERCEVAGSGKAAS